MYGLVKLTTVRLSRKEDVRPRRDHEIPFQAAQGQPVLIFPRRYRVSPSLDPIVTVRAGVHGLRVQERFSTAPGRRVDLERPRGGIGWTESAGRGQAV